MNIDRHEDQGSIHEVSIRVGYLARIDLIDELLGERWLPDKKEESP